MAMRNRAAVINASGLETPPKAGFFVWLGGGDSETLADAPRERHKFTGVGGVVLMTSTMAATSFTFALVIAAHVHVYYAIPIGMVWGAGIMNLDRWLVTATPRRPKLYQNFLLVLPRFILALIVGAVISTPLVLWIFQREINSELVTVQQQKREAFEQQLKADPELSRIPTDQANVTHWQGIIDGTSATVTSPTDAIKQLQADAATAFTNWQHWLNLADCERDGHPSCSSGSPGKGPIWHDDMTRATEFKSVYDQTEAQLHAAQGDHGVAVVKAQQSAQTNLAAATKDLNQLLAQKATLTTANNARLVADDGLLARLDALTKLTDTNSTLETAYIGLALFITAIETMPVLTKFLMNVGGETLYDKVLVIKDKARTDAMEDDVLLATETRRVEHAERRRVAAETVGRRVREQEEAETRRAGDGRWATPGTTEASTRNFDPGDEQAWHYSVPTDYASAPPRPKRRRWGRSADTTAEAGSEDYGYWTPGT